MNLKINDEKCLRSCVEKLT